MKITFLGTGTSHGVPTVDCIINNFSHCPKGVCKDSFTDKKHNRTRSSILIEIDKTTILIDASADFREQVLREKVKKIDALLITHIHTDHIMGIPDIRSYTRLLDKPLPVFGSSESVEGLKKTFSYIFDPKTFIGGGIPSLDAIKKDKSFKFNDIEITPIPVNHGSLSGCVGYRISDVAYIPDCKSIPNSSMELMRGIKTLIIDTLRMTHPHSTHMILPESSEVVKELGVEKCYLTHMCHEMHYKNDAHLLSSNTDFAYDGLVLNL